MLSPDVLLDLIAEKLRLIPELAGVPIFTYDEEFPIQTDLYLAIWKLKPPSMLVVWRGSAPSSAGRMEVWRHSYSVVIRSAEEANGSHNYFQLWTAIANGTPNDGTGCQFRRCELHEGVYAMHTPSILRQTIFVTPETRLDYHEVMLSYDEKGDY